MSRWWRAYGEAVDDPKLWRLTDKQHRAWFHLCCVACQNDGSLPHIEDIAFKLRLSVEKARHLVAELAALRLVDIAPGGKAMMHNWEERQFQSTSSTSRVQRYRDKRKAAGLPIMGDYTQFKPTLIKRDGERCIYCETCDHLVVDHMVPIALGGTDDEDNLGLACRACNSGKAGRTPELARMTIRVTTASLALRRYRDKISSATVTETKSVTSPYTDTEADTEKKERDIARASISKPDGLFDEILAAVGLNPKTAPVSLAGLQYQIQAWIAGGADPTRLLAAFVRAYTAYHDKPLSYLVKTINSMMADTAQKSTSNRQNGRRHVQPQTVSSIIAAADDLVAEAGERVARERSESRICEQESAAFARTISQGGG